MKTKFLWLLASVQHLSKLTGRMMHIRGGFSGGFSCVSVNISCLAHLSEEREALALTPDPGKAASIAARHSHATGVGGWGEYAKRLDKGTLEFGGHTHKVFFLSLQATCGVIFSKANHYILVVFCL